MVDIQAARSITWVSREQFLRAGYQRILDVDVVLEIGPGIQPQRYIAPPIHICVEPHLPYIEYLKQHPVFGKDPRYVFLNAPWEGATGLFPSKSVDTVFALDVIEHWEKEAGQRFIQEAERVARRQIVILTPLGFYPQSSRDPGEPDIWGMDGGDWQAHRSGWLPDDFDAAWEIIGCDSFHLIDEYRQPLEKPHGAFWAILTFQTNEKNRYLSHLAFGWAKNRLRRLLPPETSRSLGTQFNRLLKRPLPGSNARDRS
jgi:hypothetical protein